MSNGPLESLSTSNFGNTAVKLSQGPLGIIALFIVMVYGFACLVVGFSNGSLILIWFLVLFPTYVFTVFWWLVACRHGKLYPPGAFQSVEILKLFLWGHSTFDQRQSKATAPKSYPKAAASLVKEATGHIFWLSHDLMWTADTLLRQAPMGQTLTGIEQAIHHLNYVGLGETPFHGDLEKIRIQIKNSTELSPQARDDYANQIGAIIDALGAIMESAQSNFIPPPEWYRIR